jgi:hypothetical protein
MNTRTIALPLLCLLLPLPTPSFSQQAASNFPQSNLMQDSQAVRDTWRKAYKDFKPPAAVAAKLDELKWRDSEAIEMWSAGELDQAAMSLEFERYAVLRHLLMVSLL